MMDIEQEDPLSALQTTAVTHWTIFEAYVKAGFDRAEAMQVVLEYVNRLFDE